MKNIAAAILILMLAVPAFPEIGEIPEGSTQALLLPNGVPAPGIGFEIIDFDFDVEWTTPLLVENVATNEISSVDIGVVGKATIRYWHPADGNEWRVEQSPDMINWVHIPPIEIKVLGRIGVIDFAEVVLTVLDDPDTGLRQRQFFRVVRWNLPSGN